MPTQPAAKSLREQIDEAEGEAKRKVRGRLPSEDRGVPESTKVAYVALAAAVDWADRRRRMEARRQEAPIVDQVTTAESLNQELDALAGGPVEAEIADARTTVNRGAGTTSQSRPDGLVGASRHQVPLP